MTQLEINKYYMKASYSFFVIVMEQKGRKAPSMEESLNLTEI